MIEHLSNYSSLIHISKIVANAFKKKITYYLDGKIETQIFANESEYNDAISSFDEGFILIGNTYYNIGRISVAEQNGVSVIFSILGNITLTHDYANSTEAAAAIASLGDDFIELNGKYYNKIGLVVANTNPSALTILYDFGGKQIKVAYANKTDFDAAIDSLKGATTDKVKAPLFSVPAGGVTAGTKVSITCATDGATIYYTTDGSTPTTSSTEYTGEITISEAVTIKAFAVKEGLTDSAVSTAAYTIVLPKVATPTFTPAAGAVSSGTTVAIACDTQDSTIYYTTDGSTPTTSSTEYTEAIEITAATTIKAIAVADGYDNSDVATAAYTIAPVTLNYYSGLYNATEQADYIPTPITKAFLQNLSGVTIAAATGKELTDSNISGDDDSGYTRYVYAYPKEYGTLSTYQIIGSLEGDIDNSFTHVEVEIDGVAYYVYYLTDSTDTNNAGIIYK